MTDLSKTLVDAAAEALSKIRDPETVTPNSTDRFRATHAVAAVLETLAVGAESDYACFHPTRLRGLAAEVKTGEDTA